VTLGDAGTGKSLFFQYLLNQILVNPINVSTNIPWLPILIPLPAFRHLLFARYADSSQSDAELRQNFILNVMSHYLRQCTFFSSSSSSSSSSAVSNSDQIATNEDQSISSEDLEVHTQQILQGIAESFAFANSNSTSSSSSSLSSRAPNNSTTNVSSKSTRTEAKKNNGPFENVFRIMEQLSQYYRFLFLLDGLDELGEFVDIYNECGLEKFDFLHPSSSSSAYTPLFLL